MLEEKSFFTFGSGHSSTTFRSLASKYWVGTREELFKIRGGAWSFEYPMSELDEMRFRWGLTEATTEEIQPLVNDDL